MGNQIKVSFEQLDQMFDGILAHTDGHVWRQIGMTGSDHDECSLCGAKGSGLGQDSDEAAMRPCTRQLQLRRFGDGPVHVRNVLR